MTTNIEFHNLHTDIVHLFKYVVEEYIFADILN